MIFDDSLKKQVRIGPLLHSARNIGDVLHRFAKQLFILTNFPGVPYRLVGTGTAISSAGLHLLLCCHHQFRDAQPDQVAIHSFSANSMITGSRVIFPTVDENNADTDFIDVRAFEFRPGNYGIPNLSRDFFEISEENHWSRSRAEMFLVLGYPSQLQNADYETPEIKSRAVFVSTRYDGASHSPFVHRLRMERERLRFDADGMSGGPVFYIGRRDREFFVGFAGMTIRGGANTDILHFVSADFLLTFVDDVVSGEVAARA